MGFLHWAQQEWFSLLQSVGIVSGLVFTAVALRADAKSRRISNLISITEQHRDVWKLFYSQPNLSRILRDSVDLHESPVKDEEAIFLTFAILHLSSSYYAMKNNLSVNLEGLRQDITSFFRLPIPRSVWEKSKSLQNKDFVSFVDSCLFGDDSSPRSR